MAENTYKKKKSTKEKKSGGGLKMPSIRIDFLQDRRFELTFGFFLLVSSLFLFTAFLSYLFTGQADQSKLLSLMGGMRKAKPPKR